MKETTISKNGQTTVPAYVRKKLGLKPGASLFWTVLPDATIRVRVKKLAILDLAGILEVPDGTHVSIKDMRV